MKPCTTKLLVFLLAPAIAAAQPPTDEPTMTPASGPESRTGYPFTAMDKDQDGKVTLVEFTVASQSGRKAGLPPEEKQADHPGAQSGKMAAPGLDRQRADSGAGVSRAESATAEMTRRFNELDRDGTGWLSEQEVEAYQAVERR